LVQKFYGDESLALALADAVGDDKITMAALSVRPVLFPSSFPILVLDHIFNSPYDCNCSKGYLIKYKHRPQDTLANLPSFLAEHQQTEAAK
jgi:hypothetical protein